MLQLPQLDNVIPTIPTTPPKKEYRILLKMNNADKNPKTSD
jgi:hypothetical protein